MTALYPSARLPQSVRDWFTLRRMDETKRQSRAIATTNRNSNFVLALLHKTPPGRFGHALADGLRPFGVTMLFGIEPAVYLIGRAVTGRNFAGRNANFNPLLNGYVSPEELDRRVRQHLRSLGFINE